MIENQDIEFKKIWKDEYLSTICGFANSKGGKLYIGIDDDGSFVGVGNKATKLVKEIPNKIRDKFHGMIAPTEIIEKEGKFCICITINSYPTPIDYNGIYYIRAGSNTHKAVGVELERLLNKNRYKTNWESEIIYNVNIDDLNLEAIKIFKARAEK